MFATKVTKELIKKNLDSFFGITTNALDKDISIAEKNIVINFHIDDISINYVEMAKMFQKQLTYELNELTDSNDYKVDIILGL